MPAARNAVFQLQDEQFPLLAAAGADVHEKSSQGISSLDYLCGRGFAKTAVLLQRRSACRYVVALWASFPAKAQVTKTDMSLTHAAFVTPKLRLLAHLDRLSLAQVLQLV